VLSELADVLARARFRRWLSEDEAAAFVASLRCGARVVDDPPPEPGVTPDPDDDYVVALARAAGADYLVSGDRHLTDLSDPDPPVLTPVPSLSCWGDPRRGSMRAELFSAVSEISAATEVAPDAELGQPVAEWSVGASSPDRGIRAWRVHPVRTQRD
jgi:PIN domain